MSGSFVCCYLCVQASRSVRTGVRAGWLAGELQLTHVLGYRLHITVRCSTRAAHRAALRLLNLHADARTWIGCKAADPGRTAEAGHI